MTPKELDQLLEQSNFYKELLKTMSLIEQKLLALEQNMVRLDSKIEKIEK